MVAGLLILRPGQDTDQVERIERAVLVTIADYRQQAEWTLEAHRALKSQAQWIDTCRGGQ